MKSSDSSTRVSHLLSMQRCRTRKHHETICDENVLMLRHKEPLRMCHIGGLEHLGVIGINAPSANTIIGAVHHHHFIIHVIDVVEI